VVVTNNATAGDTLSITADWDGNGSGNLVYYPSAVLSSGDTTIQAAGLVLNSNDLHINNVSTAGNNVTLQTNYFSLIYNKTLDFLLRAEAGSLYYFAGSYMPTSGDLTLTSYGGGIGTSSSAFGFDVDGTIYINGAPRGAYLAGPIDQVYQIDTSYADGLVFFNGQLLGTSEADYITGVEGEDIIRDVFNDEELRLAKEEVEIDTSRIETKKEEKKKAAKEEKKEEKKEAKKDKKDERKHEEFVPPKELAHLPSRTDIFVYEGRVYIMPKYIEGVEEAIIDAGHQIESRIGQPLKPSEKISKEEKEKRLKEWAEKIRPEIPKDLRERFPMFKPLGLNQQPAVISFIKGSPMILKAESAKEKSKEEKKEERKKLARGERPAPKEGWRPARVGEPLERGDEVAVPGDSAMEILIGREKNAVKIAELTKLKIAQMEDNFKTGVQDTQLYLDMGDILLDVEKKEEIDKFEVHTPTAIIGVRGTRFEVQVSE